VADRRLTTHIGTGGSDGSARNPPASIISARKARHVPVPANDNRAPLSLRLKRLALLLVPPAMLGGLIWYFY